MGELCADAFFRGAEEMALDAARACLSYLDSLDLEGAAPGTALLGELEVILSATSLEARRCQASSTLSYTRHHFHLTPTAQVVKAARAAVPQVVAPGEHEVGGADGAADVLYAVLVEAVSPLLHRIGLGEHEFGLVVLMALAKLGATAHVEGSEEAQRGVAAVDEAMSRLWHRGPSGMREARFLEIPPVDTPQSSPVGAQVSGNSTVVVAFSSLGDYLIRPEWTRTLRGGSFAVVHVMDPACSWYMQVQPG